MPVNDMFCLYWIFSKRIKTFALLVFFSAGFINFAHHSVNGWQ